AGWGRAVASSSGPGVGFRRRRAMLVPSDSAGEQAAGREMKNTFSDAELDGLVTVFRVMGHELRLRLLHALWQSGERSVGELEALTGIGQPGLSQQRGVLRKAELVSARRESKLGFYSLAPKA